MNNKNKSFDGIGFYIQMMFWFSGKEIVRNHPLTAKKSREWRQDALNSFARAMKGADPSKLIIH